jgi:hypothetical protein
MKFYYQIESKRQKVLILGCVIWKYSQPPIKEQAGSKENTSWKQHKESQHSDLSYCSRTSAVSKKQNLTYIITLQNYKPNCFLKLWNFVLLIHFKRGDIKENFFPILYLTNKP